MGMSASQARYLMIAGKKSDVEYQGQQINQQRTTLATQTSAYNSQLLTLDVPTPPSTDSFKTTTYSFGSNGETCTITGTQYNKATSRYTINYTTNTTGDLGKNGGTSTFTTTDGGATILANNGNTLENVVSDKNSPQYNEKKYNELLQVLTDCKIKDVNGKTITEAGADYVMPSFYTYVSNGKNMFVKQSDIAFDLNGQNGTDKATSYYVQTDAPITKSEKLEDVKVTWSNSGRMSAITTYDEEGNEVETMSLSVKTEDDDKAYEDAYNEYEYKKSKYESNMEAINAKIDIIQTQDKKLELKLQDLDTQQKALSTEMDSIKKVIDKNVETSFKTFG